MTMSEMRTHWTPLEEINKKRSYEEAMQFRDEVKARNKSIADWIVSRVMND